MLPVSTLSIEHANEHDLPALLNLLSLVGLPQDGLSNHLETAIVARGGDEIVGSAALEVYGSSALLRSVAVLPALQGKGLGQRLINTALELADAHNIRRVYLLTETAAALFPRFGFRTISRLDVDPAVKESVEFTSACPASAIVMEKTLSPE